jgi:hypothetical protein
VKCATFANSGTRNPREPISSPNAVAQLGNELKQFRDRPLSILFKHL